MPRTSMAIAGGVRVVLEVVEGPRRGRCFVLDGPEQVIVGRSRLVDCPLPEDNALSRDHFAIEFLPPDGCELRDLGSTNGTYVNQRPVERVRLTHGDYIDAGQTRFRVRVERPASSTDEHAVAGQESGTAERPQLRGSIICASCGVAAPAGVEVAQDTRHGAGPDSIHWLCDSCRQEVAVTPQPIAHYTFLRELGRGAMGIVYLAQHNDSGRKVALKLIVPESAAARSAIDRFLREMSVISQLKHPHIVEYIDQGSTGGRFWFAMEYVEGTNLELLARATPGAYPIDQACRMACQILKGLDHAHRLGFVHRDIKPENILIGRNPQGLLMAKISDFGLAKNYRGIGLSGLTFSGEMRGTIPFMPPEQMLDFKTVQPSGDLYATAATLYFLITGEYIYDHVGDGADVVHLVLDGIPVPIQHRRPAVPAALAAVIDRGLAREPADRFASAAQLRQALRRFC